ncbi:MAG: ATP-binding protein [Roseiarcus sp.]
MPRTSLFRTSSFRLVAIYLALFTVSVLILGAVVYLVVWREIASEIDADIQGETATLMREFAAHGGDRLKAIIEARSRGGSFVYGLADARGRLVAGELVSKPGEVGWTTLREPERGDEPDGEPSAAVRALVTLLNDGGVLVVGDEWRGARGATRTVVTAFLWALVGTLGLGTLGGLILSSQVLRRIEAMSSAARGIVAGDWRQRIPATGANDELAQLARTFNRMFDRIESLLEAHKAVGGNIAHDLRRPLAGAVHRLEAARGGGAGAKDAEFAIETAIADIHGVLETFNAILRIGQIESGARRAGFKPVDLAAVAREVVEAFQPAADEEGKTLVADLSVPLPLSGDRELLTQMIANLVDNALRHTPENTRIVVASARLPGAGRLTVSDNGPGAPPAELGRIFERFYRLDAARATPGDGLGLSLVARSPSCTAWPTPPATTGRGCRLISSCRSSVALATDEWLV